MSKAKRQPHQKDSSPKNANSVLIYSPSFVLFPGLCQTSTFFRRQWRYIFDEIRELSFPPLTVSLYATTTLMLQRFHKNILQLIHIEWFASPSFLKTRSR